jgi:hypothetical protein
MWRLLEGVPHAMDEYFERSRCGVCKTFMSMWCLYHALMLQRGDATGLQSRRGNKSSKRRRHCSQHGVASYCGGDFSSWSEFVGAWEHVSAWQVYSQGARHRPGPAPCNHGLACAQVHETAKLCQACSRAPALQTGHSHHPARLARLHGASAVQPCAGSQGPGASAGEVQSHEQDA